MSEQGNSNTGQGRRTRGAFPRINLKTVEELANAIQQVGHGEPARLVTVLAKLNRTATSSTTKTLLTSASRGYGLVIGSASDTHLSLTDRGIRLVSATTRHDQLSAAYEALQQNEIFRAFVEKFKHRPMPFDEVAIDFVKDQFELSEADAAAAIRVIKQNANDYGLTEPVGDREVLNPPEEILESIQESRTDDSVEQELVNLESPNGSAPEAASSARIPVVDSIAPQVAFNIQIQLPENATPETYDAIFRNIAIHLLNRTSG